MRTIQTLVCCFLLFQTGGGGGTGGQGSNRPGYSMRFTPARSQTMQSVTSGSRSSPPPTTGVGGGGTATPASSSSSRAKSTGETRQANGETQALASPSVEDSSSVS